MDLIIHIAVLTALLLGVVTGCPKEKELAPLCNCMSLAGDNFITCENVVSHEQLIAPMRAVKNSRTKVYSLTLRDSSLLYLPHDIFRGTNVEKIGFFRTEIMSLSDTDSAFVGLEDTLTEIRATGAEFVSQWNWYQIHNLRKLSLIDVHEVILRGIYERFPKLPELTHLGIIKAHLVYIADNAFKDLPKLTIFNIQDNDLGAVRRNIFPNPAEHLASIDLSNNKISNLPEDFFSNMPSLKDVFLQKNKFKTLNEKIFSNVLNNVSELLMYENPIKCDCKMRWIVRHEVPQRFIAQCDSPDSLKGTELRHLDLKSLQC